MIFFALFLLLILIPAAWAGVLAAPFVPIWGSDVDRVLNLIPKGKNLTFVELGFGSGKLLMAIPRNINVVGFEIQPLLFLIVWLRTRNLKNIKLLLADFFKADLSSADVVFLYWTEKTTYKVKNLKLKKKATIISYAFPILGWKPVAVDEVKGKLPIFVYQLRR